MSTSTSPVSIAASTSAQSGGGSVINVSSLVSQLVSVAQLPQQTLINNQGQVVTTEISALGTLKGALSTFQSSLAALSTPSAFNALTASSSNTSAFTATASATAVPGTYSIGITQLAQAQQLSSRAFVGGASAVVGTGTLSLSLGGTSFGVTIDSSNNTLSGIAAAINSASGNPGITATVLTGSDGAHLVLSSSLTGAANTIQLTETDTGSGLAMLTYSSGSPTNYTQQTAAQDAQFSVAGVNSTSASNTVTNAISAVTLNLLAKTSSNATLTVSNNTAVVQANIGTFVSAYNTLAATFSSLGSYDPTTNTAGPMVGNSLLTGTQDMLRNAFNSIVNTGSSTYNTLASIGITSNRDGTLSLDSTALSGALATNFAAVSQLFSGTNGIAASLNTQVTNALGSNGFLTQAGQALTKQSNALTQQSDDLKTQMAALSASLTTQFTSLNTLLSSLQTTSGYLSQALSSLPAVGGNSSGG
jgi:flagellar hook-associated protein 2